MKIIKRTIRRLFESVENVLNWLLAVILEALNHGLSLVVLIVVCLLFFVFPQTSDLLLILNQVKLQLMEVPLFFVSLTVLAFLISNLNDYLHDTSLQEIRLKRGIKKVIIPKDKKEDQYNKSKMEDYDSKESREAFLQRRLPKVLGTLLILISALAVIFLFENINYSKKFWYWIVLAIILFFLICALHQKVSLRISTMLKENDKKERIPLVLGALALLYIFIMAVFNNGGNTGIIGLFGALVSLAILFYIVSTSYNERILKLKNKYGFPLLALLTGVTFVLYLYFLVYPQHAKWVNPLTIINVSLIALYSFFYLIKVVGAIKGVPLLGFAIILLFLAGTFVASQDGFNHYKVSISETKVSPEDYERSSISQYIRSWLDYRSSAITNFRDKGEKFPVIFVSSEGGGSRAGAWSFLVNSYLVERNPDYFEKYLFSMTGASGGAVGNGMFYSHARRAFLNGEEMNLLLNDNSTPLKYKASKVMSGNYLSSSIAALLGRDLLQSVFGILPIDDRSKLLENEWEEGMAKVFNYPEGQNPLKAPITDFNFKENDGYTLPILIMNTSNLQSGEYGVFCPVGITSDEKNMGVFIDILGRYVPKEESVKVSTTMSLAARFPFVSPLGKIKGLGQFGDAGYYDNLGGGVTQRLVNVFREILEEKPYQHLKSTLDIRHLVIVNKPEEAPIAYRTQLLAPLLTLINTSFGFPEEMKKTLGDDYQIASSRTEIDFDVSSINTLRGGTKKNITPILPLGRYLSEIAVQSLEERLEHDTITEKLNKLVPYKTVE
ncbi:hypothetical protein FGF1_29720 [Flavobacteriaceae bacterium GF1]